MHEINRSAAIIKPKSPYAEWANALPDAEEKFASQIFQMDCSVVLIPEYDDLTDARAHINKIWKEIFEEELYGWCTLEEWWPQKRTQKMFWDWFEVEFHGIVFDPYEEEIKKHA